MKPGLAEIIAETERRAGLERGALIGRSRAPDLCVVRRRAMYLCRTIRPDVSLPQIGRAMRRDHTTILTQIRKHREEIMCSADHLNAAAEILRHFTQAAYQPVPQRTEVRLIVEWRDMWIGAFWDRAKRRLYILPIPCVGLVIQFGGRHGQA